jgi:radical SAM protein with 4Fe4S-binding SPASM domain
MRDSGLNPGAMATITSNTIRDPEGFYLFFAEKGIDLQFNPIFKAEVQAEENSIYITPKQYSDFCCKVFDLWIDDQKNLTNIYNFATIAQAFFRHEKIVPTCTFNENCFDAFVTMDTGGDLYHCHRTVGNKDMCSGNIASMDMTEFMHDGEFMKNRAGLLKASSCYGCDNFSYCYGGCPYNAYLYKGSFFEKDYFCYAYQTVNHHIYDYLKDHERK